MVLLHHDDDVIEVVQVAVGVDGTPTRDEEREQHSRRGTYEPCTRHGNPPSDLPSDSPRGGLNAKRSRTTAASELSSSQAPTRALNIVPIMTRPPRARRPSFTPRPGTPPPPNASPKSLPSGRQSGVTSSGRWPAPRPPCGA